MSGYVGRSPGWGRHVAVAAVLFLLLSPFLWLLQMSLKSNDLILQFPPPLIFKPTFEHYRSLWNSAFSTSFVNSLLSASFSTGLALLLGVVSLIWVVPTFLLAILAQDLQTQIYNLVQVNVSGGYATFSAGQLAWSAAVLAIRPAAYAYRQGSILIADQSRQLFVRTALSKGLPWGVIVRRHIVRPAAAGLLQTGSSSIRLMFGSLPLVEFFFGYPGLGNLLLNSLGVSTGASSQPPDPGVAIASAVVLASFLAILEALIRVLTQKADPRVAEAASEAAA